MGLSWKALISKIHPPLPMSPRESQRLLTLLNTSFKQQLDRHHPTSLEDHTGLHLHSILSNPLFDVRSNNRKASFSTRDGKGGKCLGLAQDLAKRPMDIFKEQISAGTATLQSAMLCLQAEYKICLASPTATMANAMRTSRTGSIMLEWLWCSGTESSGTFLGNVDFTRLIVPFLVAEKRHDRIWHWLQILRSGLTSASSPPLRASIEKNHRNLLLELVKSEITVGEGLDAAIALFIRSVNESEQEIVNGIAMHRSAAWYLTNVLKGIPKAVAIQDDMIQSFMEAAGTMRKPNILLSACHWVHLAKKPDPKVALGYFKHQLSYDGTPSKKRLHIVLLGLKTAEVLLEGVCQAEALWVMDHLQTNFGKEIGSFATSDQDRQSQRILEEAEESSLRSLDALAIH